MAQEIRKSESIGTVPSRYSDPFAAMRNEMDRILDTFLRPGWRGSNLFRAPAADIVVPNIDVRESATEMAFEAELPGLSDKDVEITLRDGILTLRGQKKFEKEETKDDYHLTERSYGSFERSFRVPDTVDPDKASAKFEKGVLTIKLPKKPEAARSQRKIEVKSS